MHMIKL